MGNINTENGTDGRTLVTATYSYYTSDLIIEGVTSASSIRIDLQAEGDEYAATATPFDNVTGRQIGTATVITTVGKAKDKNELGQTYDPFNFRRDGFVILKFDQPFTGELKVVFTTPTNVNYGPGYGSGR